MLNKEYMAGYIDGRGGLSVDGIYISDNEKWILSELQKYCGGRIGICSTDRSKNICYRLHMNRTETIKLLEDIMDYLIFKKSRAKKIMDFLKSEMMDAQMISDAKISNGQSIVPDKVKPDTEIPSINKPIDICLEDKDKSVDKINNGNLAIKSQNVEIPSDKIDKPGAESPPLMNGQSMSGSPAPNKIDKLDAEKNI